MIVMTYLIPRNLLAMWSSSLPDGLHLKLMSDLLIPPPPRAPGYVVLNLNLHPLYMLRNVLPT